MSDEQVLTTDAALSEPIDVVYTWVDGSDIAWQAARDKYIKEYQSLINSSDSNGKYRYRNRDELKYSLRSVYQFASFVNHIYIVTNGQRPSWLQEHPKISIVTHKEIFKNRDDLPTFNSHAIEANLHRIPGLSDKFIYFNDDVFLASFVSPHHFFSKANKILAYVISSMVPRGVSDPRESSYSAAWKNTDALLSACYGQGTRYQLAHVAHGLTRSLMEEVEKNFSQIFSYVSSHKFRVFSDFVLTNGLFQYFAFYNKKLELVTCNCAMVTLRADIEDVRRQFQTIREFPCRFICLQDESLEENEAITAMCQEFFTTRFPVPAPWEKA